MSQGSMATLFKRATVGFLHLSKNKQRERFLSRINEPDKNWKFSAADIKERGFWNEYEGL